jgi:hypothetical protein
MPLDFPCVMFMDVSRAVKPMSVRVIAARFRQPEAKICSRKRERAVAGVEHFMDFRHGFTHFNHR